MRLLARHIQIRNESDYIAVGNSRQYGGALDFNHISYSQIQKMPVFMRRLLYHLTETIFPAESE